MQSLASLLPAPTQQQPADYDSEPVEKVSELSLATKTSHIPPYGQRSGWRPSNDADFADGGAYPECNLAQYPNGMGKKAVSSGGTLALQTDTDGKVRFDVIAQQGHRSGRIVQSQFKDLVPLAHRTDVTEEQLKMQRPSDEDVQKTTEKTQAALEKLATAKIRAANPKNVPSQARSEAFVRYTPGGLGGGDGKQRIIKMVDVVQDPLEPPKFKAKKIPKGPPSPPAPILRSPPRKVTAQEQRDWMIPPSVSNWKNNKGYTIPLDKRLAADGRGLQDVTINDRFATLSEALYVADRHAREEVRARAQMQQRIAQKEKEAKEESLRQLAARARERAAPTPIAGSSQAPRLAQAGGGAAMASALAGYGDSDDEGAGEGGRTPRGPPPEEDDEDESDPDRPEDERAARDRDEMRKERRREREREMRMSNMGTERRARVLAKAQNRDISEKVALGLAKPTMSKEAMLDSRLFNQEQYSGSFADEDSYALYDKPLFQATAAANAIYKPRGRQDEDDDEATAQGIKSSMRNDRFGLGVAGRGFEGADLQGVREGPVQFEKDSAPMTAANPADPFGVDAFLNEAAKGGSRKHGLDTTGGREERDAKRRARDDDEL